MSTTSIPESQIALFRNDSSTLLKTISVPSPDKDEVLVRNIAVASNPKDWKHPAWEKNYDYVEGSDVAGVIVKVGDDVKEFKIGDRVTGFTKMGAKQNKYGAYAQYSVTPAATTIHLPTNVSFEAGSTLPLAVFTAAVSLFVDLGLPQSSDLSNPVQTTESSNKAFIVYGASSSVGAYATQLAKRAGFFVVGIAGSSADYAKSVGPDVVVDYRSKSNDTLVDEIQAALGSRVCAHAIDCISEGDSTLDLARVLAAKNGPEKKSTISRLLPPTEGLKDLLPPGVEVIETFIGSAFGKDAEFCRNFARQLTKALDLSNSTPFKPNNVRVMPNGLESVGEGLELLRSGKVSGAKLVYRIDETPEKQKK